MQGVDKQPHTLLSRGQVTPVVLVVGDPARAALVASMCEKSEEIAYNREYRTFSCEQKGKKFLVSSHGVGSAGCAICFEELIQNGAKCIIRAGTAGSLQPTVIKQGDVVVCHSAVREDGVSALLVPSGFPAIADPHVFQSLERVVAESGVDCHYGMSLSSDLFYQGNVLPSTLETWAKAKVEVVEMELSTLFIIAKIRGIRAGGLVCVDGSPFKWDAGDYDPTGAVMQKGKQKMLKIAIDAVVRLTEEYETGLLQNKP